MLHTKLPVLTRAILLICLLSAGATLSLSQPAEAIETREVREALARHLDRGEEFPFPREVEFPDSSSSSLRSYAGDPLPFAVGRSRVTDPAHIERVGKAVNALSHHMPWADSISLFVFKGEMPYATLYGRTLAVSTGALSLLDDLELRAAIAPALSHWLCSPECRSALDRQDWRQVRQVEFMCAGLGLYYFYKSGGTLGSFISATWKVGREQLALEPGAASSSLVARINFIIRVAGILSIPTESSLIASQPHTGFDDYLDNPHSAPSRADLSNRMEARNHYVK